MFKRIKEISGVGPYAACKAAAAQLQNWTVIYGSNSYGKSTLSEVLKTLESPAPGVEPITARRTIPAINGQTVSLTLSHDSAPEQALEFKNGQWASPIPFGYKVAVFDSGFISRNLFTGPEVGRQNKEALTQFVLGEQGVAKAKEIADLNKTIVLRKNELKAVEQGFKDVGDIKKFVDSVVAETEAEIEALVEIQRVEIATRQAKIESAEQISARRTLDTIAYLFDSSSYIDELNSCFEISIESVDAEARRRFELHVESHLGGNKDAGSWIRTGNFLSSSDSCPFCAQELSQDAKTLLDSYSKIFNQTFIAQFADLNKRMEISLKEIERLHSVGSGLFIESNNDRVQLYPELKDDIGFGHLAKHLGELGALVSIAEATYRDSIQEIHERISPAVDLKRATPHIQLPHVDSVQLQDAEKALTLACDAYNETAVAINERLTQFKNGVVPFVLREEIVGLTARMDELSAKRRRIQLHPACEEHKRLSKALNDIDDKIRLNKDELAQEQSTFLTQFFAKINEYFVKFGSRDFSISTENFDVRGHLPVISLVVHFKKVKIQPAQIFRVMSESDRRAFALSIFWARLALLSEDEKQKTILVLDDPVTSFDDNRISVTMMTIKQLADEFRQTILLTHYPLLVQHILNDSDIPDTLALLKIVKREGSSTIVNADKAEYVEGEHHKKFKKILAFINGHHESSIDSDLRVFLETEVRERYRLPIHDHQLEHAMLSELIDELSRLNIIEIELATKLHGLRNNLNGPHHVWSSRSPEDWSSIAQEMLSVVYQEM